MAITYPQSPAIYAQPARRGPIARLLEQEHWLAVALLLPTVVLLGLFIAYAFVKGVSSEGRVMFILTGKAASQRNPPRRRA